MNVRALPGLLIPVLFACAASPAVPAREEPVALSAAEGLLVEEGALFDGPEAGAARLGVLPAQTRVRLAARGLGCHRFGGDRCAVRWRLAGRQAWVDGAALAVAQATPGVEAELGGALVHEAPAPPPGSRAPAFTWFGVRSAWEWEEELGRGRIWADGFLAAETPEGMRVVPLGGWSGWGSSEVLFDRRWLDLDADGAAELIVAWRASITEVGYGGQHVRVLDGALGTRLELEVGDPTLTGLSQGAFGAVRLEGDVLVQDSLQVTPCAPGLPPPPRGEAAGVVCFRAARTRYVKLLPQVEPLVVRAGGDEVIAWYHPDGAAPTDRAPVRVLVRRGGSTVWLDAPPLEPAWAAGVFGAEQERVRWVTLW